MANFVANLISRQWSRRFLSNGLCRNEASRHFYGHLSGSVHRYESVTVNTNRLFSPSALEGQACVRDSEAKIALQPLLF